MWTRKMDAATYWINDLGPILVFIDLYFSWYFMNTNHSAGM